MITAKEQKNINTLRQKAQKDNEVLALIHFGSSITENHHRDVDLCIISHHELSSQIKLKYHSFLPEHYDISFFGDLPMYIKHEVLKTGKILLNKNPDLLYNIVFRFIKEYAYFQPHFKKYLEVVKEC